MTDGIQYRHVLLDTGPLVAILSPNESQHQKCTQTAARIAPPLLTCWPVITEAAWLLRADTVAIRQLLANIDGRRFTTLELADRDLREIERLYAQYEDLSPQLADLALLHLAEREGLDTVFTLDRRDFGVFRLKGKKRLHLLPEDD